jgi:hypothetical protein
MSEPQFYVALVHEGDGCTCIPFRFSPDYSHQVPSEESVIEELCIDIDSESGCEWLEIVRLDPPDEWATVTVPVMKEWNVVIERPSVERITLPVTALTKDRAEMTAIWQVENEKYPKACGEPRWVSYADRDGELTVRKVAEVERS